MPDVREVDTGSESVYHTRYDRQAWLYKVVQVRSSSAHGGCTDGKNERLTFEWSGGDECLNSSSKSHGDGTVTSS